MSIKEKLSEAIDELNQASAAVEKQTQIDSEEIEDTEWRISCLQTMVRYLLANCRVESLLRESLGERVRTLENEVKFLRDVSGQSFDPPFDNFS
jgi:hypothetical protein